MSGEGRGVRRQKSIHWWRICRGTGSYTRGRVQIRFGTYNFHNGNNGGSKSALRGMYQVNMDLVIFQETKVTARIYTRGSAGYSVVATDTPIQHCGRVAVFYRPAPHFLVEAVQ